MHDTKTLRPSELALSSYGSLLRKPVIGWGLAVVLLVLIIFSLMQLVPFFRSSNPQYGRVLLAPLAVTEAITVIPVLVLRWLDRREPEPWLFYFLSFAWGGLIATAVAGDVNTSIDKVLGGLLSGILTEPFIEEAVKGLGLLVFVLLLRDEFDGPRDGFIYGALLASIAIGVAVAHIQQGTALKRIIFCLFSAGAYTVYQKHLRDIQSTLGVTPDT